MYALGEYDLMAVAFANNWDIILSKLESLFRTEFKGALKVYSGLQNEMEGNQYLRLSPVSSSLVDYSTTLETREFSIGMVLYFKEPNIKKTGTDNVMRLVSRIETIIANNNSITLPDDSVVYDCKIESSEIEASDSEYLVEFDFKCTHANSITYPTVNITAAEVLDGASSADDFISLTFKTSHATTDFVVGDVSVSNGSLSSFAGSGTTYTATFTPVAGSGIATTIQVVAGKFSDYSGNKNVASDVFNWNTIYTNIYSLAFDGTNDYVDGIGNCPTGNFTFSAWAINTHTSTNPFHAIYSAATELWIGVKVGDSPSGYGYAGVHIGGQSIFVTAAATFVINQWYHIAVTWDGSNGKIWINGVLRKTQALSGVTITATAPRIGQYSTSTGNAWVGNIDEVSIWSEVLGEADIGAIYNSGTPIDITSDYSDNLVGYWRFEEGSGTDVADSSGNDNDGDINNATHSTTVPS